MDTDPELLSEARETHADASVDLLERDFLGDLSGLGEFRYVVGNPPYVPIEGLSEDEKARYKQRFDTATGRFDLFILFIEQSLNVLSDGGRLTLITPEKFEYTETAAPLRRLLARDYHVREIHHIEEDAFDGFTTYPTITTVDATEPGETRVLRRDGSEDNVTLSANGNSWASTIRGGDTPNISGNRTLGDVCQRVSCGVATGADSVFVQDADEVPEQLSDWTYPTTSGKQLRINDGPDSGEVFICPYREDGRLPSENDLEAFGDWASFRRDRLEDRSCVKKNKCPWYGWHENPPMEDILQPKILCQDVTDDPTFWLDETGEVVPRHSVYYIIPEDPDDLYALHEFLNSPEAHAWFEANCQRAANGYLRLQSRVMKKLPVPDDVKGEVYQTTLTDQ
ncbi:BREX-1 system adenine-specific DNA-methyltransferase PglX [Halanaeroarchaeum sp. HSR-CO]|uniref:BREX-1 system adenine-specific DNA-methyltransferase PglX n=1 Tax=Halanaeroarchaeum sp. HSR-CO TaxID=2866382 RepID=UPI00217EB2BB|nr:BREX-1 system adenine-specific DNA-methyltransferase PglX [Halanaeroarchaeum sp. HSR-CO]